MNYLKLLLSLSTATFLTASAFGQDAAGIFGARESAQSMSLSPDGTRVAFIEPAKERHEVLMIASVTGGHPKAVIKADGAPWRLNWCEWASNHRLVCEMQSIANEGGILLGFRRLVAVNDDGSGIKELGQRSARGTLGMRQFDGDVISWPQSDDGTIIMGRYYSPESETGTRLAQKAEGLAVDKVDTVTLKSNMIEPARRDGIDYIADENGEVRIMATADRDEIGVLRGVTRYFYRTAGQREWKQFSRVEGDDDAMQPVAVNGTRNVAYAYGKKDGRLAAYSVALDGSLTPTLLLAHDKVDVDGFIRLGRSGRIIGAQYVTDKREKVLFDSEYKKLTAQLAKALPGLPLVHLAGASRDETKLLLFAGSDTDAGRYYLYDKGSRQLNELALIRPQLEAMPLAPVKPISYPASDGTQIPGYLTLPPNSDGKNLPAIVMPHGGPSARDEWGFDWLAQYFAHQGYAVLQPNFRGSAGYGDDWYVENGFKSWRTSVGDVNDAGRWLVREGIARSTGLGVVGWSYGGYAALQSGALDADLFKAVIAIAPVTDLKMLVEQASFYTNSKLVDEFVGAGPHVVEGSPLQQASRLKAPVLMFSGDMDLNVAISHARAMDKALKAAGKSSQLIEYPGLAHAIDDSAARKDMLGRSLAFLRAHLK